MPAFIEFLGNASLIFWVIMLLSVVMWWTIARCYLQYGWQYPALCKHYQAEWAQWQDQSHLLAVAVRDGFISELQSQLTRKLIFIKTLTGVLPLLGLLGTVDGMIDNFSVLSDSLGVSELFSSGIAQALLTTLAGLVTGLSGLFFCHSLHKRANLLTLDLAQKLVVKGI
ncbi:MotA/TolQ/ExbB proton channel family protein [Moritella sp. Urea-trap-13]|uniref:MotA/TolQ/ExbB proton channel family protein n=1 Tax=Moritella sp. Urea-trap-13 TaxID=2058327 RepID=UPI000C328E4B|nr:MotA/TolQ/ExbB proton channel family protein [Moritella sp. Urea-trap-13]PKH04912.1 energy transducer TonB [Moritella sp. Urea-trap-13]